MELRPELCILSVESRKIPCKQRRLFQVFDGEHVYRTVGRTKYCIEMENRIEDKVTGARIVVTLFQVLSRPNHTSSKAAPPLITASGSFRNSLKTDNAMMYLLDIYRNAMLLFTTNYHNNMSAKAIEEVKS